MNIHPIAYMKSDFSSKFGIPRQSGLVESLESSICFIDSYRNPDYLRGIEEYSHLWILWEFSDNKNVAPSPTVRPPRLGGNVRKGVFATRSPYRPNPLGLSCVRLSHVEWDSPDGPILHVLGADLLDGTPIYDIKPYVSFSDSHPEAVNGFAEKVFDKSLQVIWEDSLSFPYDDGQKTSLLAILAQDPRPSYQNDPDRIYGMEFAGHDVHFKVDGSILTITEII